MSTDKFTFDSTGFDYIKDGKYPKEFEEIMPFVPDTRTIPDGQFGRSYVTVENGKVTPQPYSDRDMLLLNTEIGYDYEVKKVDVENGNAYIKHPSVPVGQYNIINLVSSGPDNNYTKKYTDTTGALNGVDNRGLDIVMVQDRNTGKVMVVFQGSALKDGYTFANDYDWQNNALMGQNRTNVQFEHAMMVMDYVKKNDPQLWAQIVAMGGNSLGGGTASFIGNLYALELMGLKVRTYNPAGVPQSMIDKYLKDILNNKAYKPNQINFINNLEILFAAQTGGGKYDIHQKYLGENQFMPVGLNSLLAITENHRGANKRLDNESYTAFLSRRNFPSVHELAAFDLLSGNMLNLENSSGKGTTEIKLDPELLRMISSNYKSELDETRLLTDVEYQKIEYNLMYETDVSSAKFSKLLSQYGGQFKEKTKDLKIKLTAVATESTYLTMILGGALTIPSCLFFDHLHDLLINFERAIDRVLEQLKNILKSPFVNEMFNVSPKASLVTGNVYDPSNSKNAVLQNLKDDITILHRDFLKIHPSLSSIPEALNSIADDFDAVDKNIGIASQRIFKDGQYNPVDKKDYEKLNAIKNKVEHVINDAVAPSSPILRPLHEINAILDSGIVNLISKFLESEDEIKKKEKKLNDYLYSHPYLAPDGFRYRSHSDYELKSNSPSYSHDILSKTSNVKIQGQLDECKKGREKILNIEDTLNTLKTMDLPGYVVGILQYYKSSMANDVISGWISSDVNTKLEILNGYNNSLGAVTNNLYYYINQLKGNRLKQVKEAHGKYMKDYVLYGHEINDITVNDADYLEVHKMPNLYESTKLDCRIETRIKMA